MRTAILSDVHGNLAALDAVLVEVARLGADAVHVLGDIVGYGPEPAACVAVVRERAAVSLLGNHDAAAVGLTDREDFNEFARAAIEWTAAVLGPEEREYLAGLPYVHRAGGLLSVHASPLEPARWHYIHGRGDAADHFAHFGERACFVGHSHRPGCFALAADGTVARCGTRERLAAGRRYLVNVGSVGQPRDRDPRAAFVIHDARTGTGPGGRSGSGDLATDLRDFVAGSLARYDEVKSGAAGFRRQGWFPSFFLRDPAADVVLEPGPGAGKAVTVHVSHARRDVEQRLVVAPVDRFVLPGADRRFFAELLAALAVASPEISRARIRFWFGVLQPDGRMGWELQGSLALTAAAARRAPPGKRNQETVWPLLEENSVPASLWP